MQAKLTESIGSLEAAFLSGKPEAIAVAQGVAQSALDELGSIRKTAFATGANMARSYDAIPKEGKSPIEYQYLVLYVHIMCTIGTFLIIIRIMVVKVWNTRKTFDQSLCLDFPIL